MLSEILHHTPLLYISNANLLNSLSNLLKGIPFSLFIAITSFVHAHIGDGIPVPLPILP